MNSRARVPGPRVLDLFSGCGGLALGFVRAGCRSIGGIELDPLASLSYAVNFHLGDLDHIQEHARSKDITATEPNELMHRLGVEEPLLETDILVGGPPCPAFARVGRAKLREINQHPEAFRHDPRAQLYIPYLRYVEALAPIALVMENVPDILNYGGHNLGEEIAESLENLGYHCAYTLLNSANYGVPQMRERFFLVAIHELADAAVQFPVPGHRVEFPAGYEGSRQVALKQLDVSDQLSLEAVSSSRSRYVSTPKPGADARPPMTAEDALADLPPITAHLEGTDRRGARRFTTPVAYRADLSPSAYARDLREWPGFSSSGVVWDHVTRCLSERDYRLFRALRPGDEYPAAHALAERYFNEALARAQRRGRAPREGTAEYKKLRAAYVPPYDAGKFPNKWRKMERDRPARTLMAHLGKDTYSHIHYDSSQSRVISVREAARLQSFPDGFVFAGTMNPAFRQVGNSVPPLLSYAIAKTLLSSLDVAAALHGHSGTASYELRQDALKSLGSMLDDAAENAEESA